MSYQHDQNMICAVANQDGGVLAVGRVVEGGLEKIAGFVEATVERTRREAGV
jgi:hypothetical protein